MILFLEESYRHMFTDLYNPRVAEAKPHNDDTDWRPIPGDHNPSQFWKAQK